MMTGTTLWEKLMSVPPLIVFITSVTKIVNWQTVYYAVMTLWVLVQLYFRLRKEWKKKQLAKRIAAEDHRGALAAMDAQDTDKAPLS